MPLVHGDVESIVAFRIAEDEILGDVARVIVEHDAYFASQDDVALIHVRVAMDGHLDTGFHGVQHALRVRFGRVVQGINVT